MAIFFAMAGLFASYILAQRMRFGGWVLRLILAGIVVGAVWNYAITQLYTWRKGVKVGEDDEGNYVFSPIEDEALAAARDKQREVAAQAVSEDHEQRGQK